MHDFLITSSITESAVDSSYAFECGTVLFFLFSLFFSLFFLTFRTSFHSQSEEELVCL